MNNEVAGQRTGYWKTNIYHKRFDVIFDRFYRVESKLFECSVCGGTCDLDTKYCPMCGEKMEESEVK